MKIRNNITAVISLLILFASGFAKAENPVKIKGGIQFHTGTWNQALAQAKQENKLIFLDIYASWCGPCKYLKTTTFTDGEVGKFYNVSFVNVTLDGEKGEGAVLAKKYGVRAYPTLLFVNSDGEIVKGSVGYQNPEQFINLGRSIINQ